MQPQHPQPPVVRRTYARRRLRDRRMLRRAGTGARSVLMAGAALVVLGGSQSILATAAPQHTAAGSGAGVITGGSPGLDPSFPPALPPAAGAASGSPSPSTGPTAGAGGGTAVVAGGGSIPATVLRAYLDAQRKLAATEPGCHLPWQLLAGIGEVESGQAEGGNVSADGTAREPILGPVLNGDGFAAVHDGSGWARAEGPMQFIPSTWQNWGVDANGDGRADPENVFDAAQAAADYLCAGGRDLNSASDLDAAILGYNRSDAYLSEVLAWMHYYQQTGAVPGADASGNAADGGWAPPGSSSAAKPGAEETPSPTGSGSPSGTPTRGTVTTTPRPGGNPSRPTASGAAGSGSSTSASGSASSSASPDPSSSASPDPSSGPTGSPTGGCTSTPTASGSPTADPSPTDSPSATADGTPTASSSASPTASPTDSPTPSC